MIETSLPLAVHHLSSPGHDLHATFVPGAAMLGLSLRHRGEELLGLPHDLGAYSRTGAATGIPLLHPWANRLAGFDYAAAARSVDLAAAADVLQLDDLFEVGEAPVELAVAGGGRELTVAFRGGYPYARVFAPAAQGFICFEPMTAPVDALRSGEGLRLAAPGSAFRAEWRLEVRNAHPAAGTVAP